MEGMIYNSQLEKLTIPEYGRHVQNLIESAKKIEDPVKRQATADALVDLMYRMNPGQKNTPEHMDKLWRHFFRIANYDIDVKGANGETMLEAPPLIDKKSSLPEYPENNKTFRHYGANVKRMLEKALGMEEGPIRSGFIRSIGSYMKLAYKTWNREHYVSDEIIKVDLSAMTEGKIDVEDDVALNILQSSMPTSSYPNNKRGKRNNKGGKQGKYRHNTRRRK